MNETFDETTGKTGKTVRLVMVVQCAVALERCSGFHCAWSFDQRRDAFLDYPEGLLYLPFACGGCPGRRVSRLAAQAAKRAQKLAQIGKDEIVVHLSGCIVHDSGHYPACPFKDYMTAILKQRGFRVVEGTYESTTAAARRAAGDYDAYRSAASEDEDRG